jgi:hypothetical protein
MPSNTPNDIYKSHQCPDGRIMSHCSRKDIKYIKANKMSLGCSDSKSKMSIFDKIMYTLLSSIKQAVTSRKPPDPTIGRL